MIRISNFMFQSIVVLSVNQLISECLIELYDKCQTRVSLLCVNRVGLTSGTAVASFHFRGTCLDA